MINFISEEILVNSFLFAQRREESHEEVIAVGNNLDGNLDNSTLKGTDL